MKRTMVLLSFYSRCSSLYPTFVLVDDAKERFGSAENVPDRYQMFIPLGRTYAEPLFNYNIYEDINYSQ